MRAYAWSQGFPEEDARRVRGIALHFVEADPVQASSLRDAGVLDADAVILGNMDSRHSKEVRP